MVLVTADQLVAHGVGDYILQSDWMANGKTKRWLPAILHGCTYTLPFLLLSTSPLALAVIAGTHILIDHWRLAKYVCWLKNGARGPVTATGYAEERPAWLAVWLLIIADNLLHVLINAAALRWL